MNGSRIRTDEPPPARGERPAPGRPAARFLTAAARQFDLTAAADRRFLAAGPAPPGR